MISLFDSNRKKTAILENAFDIDETKQINSVYTVEFSLPQNDPKNDLCKKYYYIRPYDEGELYRIVNINEKSNESGEKRYYCEHVITTLIDNIIFGSVTFGGIGFYTADSINKVLSYQITRNWILGTCDFARQFEYNIENENLLAALFSLANRFEFIVYL